MYVGMAGYGGLWVVGCAGIRHGCNRSVLCIVLTFMLGGGYCRSEGGGCLARPLPYPHEGIITAAAR